MAVTADKPAPYAPAAAVLDIIERYRDRGLPSPINAEVLVRAGVVTESLIPRTLQAIETLDLVDEDGKPTPTFDGLRLAPEAEFKQRLADWIKAAYADVFSFVDPATDDDIRIRDAFRSYKPFGQQGRMVTLFTGLCSKAGLIPEKASQAPRPRSSSPVLRQHAPPRIVRPRSTLGKRPVSPSDARTSDAGLTGAVPAPLAGLLATLPTAEEGWTKEKRDGFMVAFGSVLDFCFPIKQAAKAAGGKENGGT